jgi:hypothetical protein
MYEPVGAERRKKKIIRTILAAIAALGARIRAPMKMENTAVVPQRAPACMRE